MNVQAQKLSLFLLMTLCSGDLYAQDVVHCAPEESATEWMDEIAEVNFRSRADAIHSELAEAFRLENPTYSDLVPPPPPEREVDVDWVAVEEIIGRLWGLYHETKTTEESGYLIYAVEEIRFNLPVSERQRLDRILKFKFQGIDVNWDAVSDAIASNISVWPQAYSIPDPLSERFGDVDENRLSLPSWSFGTLSLGFLYLTEIADRDPYIQKIISDALNSWSPSAPPEPELQSPEPVVIHMPDGLSPETKKRVRDFLQRFESTKQQRPAFKLETGRNVFSQILFYLHQSFANTDTVGQSLSVYMGSIFLVDALEELKGKPWINPDQRQKIELIQGNSRNFIRSQLSFLKPVAGSAQEEMPEEEREDYVEDLPFPHWGIDGTYLITYSYAATAIHIEEMTPQMYQVMMEVYDSVEDKMALPYNLHPWSRWGGSRKGAAARNLPFYLALFKHAPDRQVEWRQRLFEALENFNQYSPYLVYHTRRSPSEEHGELHEYVDSISPYYFHSVIPYAGEAINLLETQKDLTAEERDRIRLIRSEFEAALSSVIDQNQMPLTLGDDQELGTVSYIIPLTGLALERLNRSKDSGSD